MKLFPRWRKDPAALERAKKADLDADQHLAQAHEHLQQAEEHIERVRSSWPETTRNRRKVEQLLETNSLSQRFLNELHQGQTT